jgi:hypothetical protein
MRLGFLLLPSCLYLPRLLILASHLWFIIIYGVYPSPEAREAGCPPVVGGGRWGPCDDDPALGGALLRKEWRGREHWLGGKEGKTAGFTLLPQICREGRFYFPITLWSVSDKNSTDREMQVLALQPAVWPCVWDPQFPHLNNEVIGVVWCFSIQLWRFSLLDKLEWQDRNLLPSGSYVKTVITLPLVPAGDWFQNIPQIYHNLRMLNCRI